jgi:osmotically inducible protein OsmC
LAAIREAHVEWNGDLASGVGAVSASTSKAFSDLPVTWGSRTQEPDGRTSPEELIAAAHASCYSMALSGGLARAGTPGEHLSVSATVTFDQVDGSWTVISSSLKVTGRVPGVDAAAFQQAAEGAKDGCPISRALKGNVALSVEATLES